MKEIDKENSTTEDILEIISMFPWWACFALALLSFIMTNHFASDVIEPIKYGTVRLRTMSLSREIIWYGRIILPVLFSIAGVISLVRKFKE
jgi:hypothetical protein